MRKLKKHISISLEIECMITEYANKCNITFSEAVSQLVVLGNNNIEVSKAIQKKQCFIRQTLF